VEPFYERLLREGTDAHNRGDYVQAIRYLRIANFGFLEEPALLAQGLSYIALSEAKNQNEEGFREIFFRIVEIEQRFQAYRQAKVPSDIRDELEGMVAALIPRETLEANPTFAHIIRRKEEARLAGLRGRDRRRELERLVVQYPDDARWRLMLAQFHLDERDWDEAIESASGVLAMEPDSSEALLIRGLAQAGDEKWDDAIEDLVASGQAGDGARQAEALLRAYVEKDLWPEASIFLAVLSEEIRGNSQVSRLARQVEQGLEAEAVSFNERSSRSTSEASRKDLDRARALLAHGKTRNDLEQAYKIALELSKEVPQSRTFLYLAGECAYRLGRWKEVIEHFRRAGGPPAAQPNTSFYLAVALFETGNIEEAAALMRSCLSGLQRSPFVESYVKKILGDNY